MSKVRGQHRSREWNNAHAKHEAQVDDEQHVISLSDMGEEPVVIDPHNADEGEADEESEIRRPLSAQLTQEISGIGAGDLDFQNQQGYGDGEYAVGESCLLYTSDAADEEDSVDLGGRRI